MDLENIIEIQQIKKILSKDENLLNMFLKVLNLVNKKFEDEIIVSSSESDTDTDSEEDYTEVP
tara:strand:- start:288 stop:476 length:189 start_codon:yes stop_codon:yes gene_type:complete